MAKVYLLQRTRRIWSYVLTYTYYRESEGLGRVYESILTTDKQKGLVVCMKVYLLQRIRRAWSCVCKYTYYRETKWQKYTYYREPEGFGRMY